MHMAELTLKLNIDLPPIESSRYRHMLPLMIVLGNFLLESNPFVFLVVTFM